MGFNDFFDEPQFDYELERNKFIDNMNMLRDMTVQESVLYKKWVEVNQQKFLDLIPKSRKVKAQIWKPTDIYNEQQTIKELENLKPSIRVVETTEDMSDWGLLRVFCHSMSFDANPGRNVKFLVYDEVTGKYLGVTNLGSDVMMMMMMMMMMMPATKKKPRLLRCKTTEIDDDENPSTAMGVRSCSPTMSDVMSLPTPTGVPPLDDDKA